MPIGNMLRDRQEQYVAQKDGTGTWRILDTWHEDLTKLDQIGLAILMISSSLFSNKFILICLGSFLFLVVTNYVVNRLFL